MAHPDLNALKDTLLPVAKRMLTEHGEFFPYGAFMKLNGEIVHCSPYDGDEHPPSKNLIDIGEGEIDLTLSYLPTSEELCKSQQQMAMVIG